MSSQLDVSIQMVTATVTVQLTGVQGATGPQGPAGSGGGAVTSVNSRTGAVVLTSADVGLSNVSNALQLVAANNLSDLTNAATARSNLGLATVATTGAYADLTGKPSLGSLAALNTVTLTSNVTGILPVANGGTGSNTQNFVDLTTDQAAIAGAKGFTGNVTVTGTTATGTSGQNAILSVTTGTGAAADAVYIGLLARGRIGYKNGFVVMDDGLNAIGGVTDGSSASKQGSFWFSSSEVLRLTGIASGVNYLNMTAAVTTARPTLSAAGSDTNIDLGLSGKGTGWVLFIVNNTGFGASVGSPLISQVRHASTAGVAMTIQAQAALVAGTDLAGGTLNLSSGISTGGSASILNLRAYGPAAGVIGTITLNNGGTAYTAGDTLTISTGGANATVIVDTVTAGVVATFHLSAGGTGYLVGNAQPVTGGTGSGAKFNITALTGTADGSQQTVLAVRNGSISAAVQITPAATAQSALTIVSTVTLVGSDLTYMQAQPTYTQTTKPGGALYGFNSKPTANHASGTGPDLYGAKFNPILTGNGSIAAIRAFQAIPEISAASTGTITTAYAVDMSPFISNASAVITTMFYMNASLGTLTGSIGTVVGFNMANHTVANLGTIIGIQMGNFTSAANNVDGIIIGALTSTATGNVKGIAIGNLSSATLVSGIEIGTLNATAGSSAVTGILIGNVTSSGSGTVRAIKTGTGVVEFGDNVILSASASQLGINTSVPTHSITLASTGTGIALYNVADQVTNYERALFSWISNVFTLTSQNGGTGTLRDIKLTVGANASIFLQSAGSNKLAFNTLSASTTNTTGANFQHTVSNTSTVSVGVSVAPVINQSSTAGYTALLVNPTESATGSGAKLLIDAQVGGTSKWSVRNDGVEFPVQAATASAPTYTKGGIYFDTTLNKLRVGGAAAWETITSA